MEDWYDHLARRWSESNPDLDLELSLIGGRISRVAVHLARRDDEQFARFGLNRGEVGVLGALKAADPPRLTPTRLMRVLLLSSAGVTSRLDRLQRRGLVRRFPDPADRRGVLVELTKEGRRLLDAAVTANAAGGQRLFATLTRQELSTLDRVLRKLLRSLEPPPG